MLTFLQTPTVCLNTVTCSPLYMVSALALPSLLCFCLPLLFIDVLLYLLQLLLFAPTPIPLLWLYVYCPNLVLFELLTCIIVILT